MRKRREKENNEGRKKKWRKFRLEWASEEESKIRRNKGENRKGQKKGKGPEERRKLRTERATRKKGEKIRS